MYLNNIKSRENEAKLVQWKFIRTYSICNRWLVNLMWVRFYNVFCTFLFPSQLKIK